MTSRNAIVQFSISAKRINQSDDSLSLGRIHCTERLNKSDFCSVLNNATTRLRIRNRLAAQSNIVNRNVIQISKGTKDPK